jgi:hypothetical protein
VGNPRELLQAETHEQELAEARTRLIKNHIIYWYLNSLSLSRQLLEREDAASEAFLHAVASGSAVSGQHITLLGEDVFLDGEAPGYGGNHASNSAGVNRAAGWEEQNGSKSLRRQRLAKSPCRFGPFVGPNQFG